MLASDSIANMLTKIRNAVSVSKNNVSFNFSNLKLEISKILKKEGFIENYEVISEGNKKDIKITLSYNKKGESPINGIKKISTSGRRVYSSYKDMGQVLNGYGIIIVSTSKGIMTEKEAKKTKVGGEIICSVW